MIDTRSTTKFNFGAFSYRDTFFSTSTFILNWGFLATPASTYISYSNYRCIIFEGPNSTSLSQSSSFKTLDISPLSSVTIAPKA